MRRCILFSIVLLLPQSAFAFTSVLDTLREQARYTTLTVHTVPVAVDGIPRGASRVQLLPLDFRASCGEDDVRVKRIRVQHTGLGDTDDIKGIYLLKGYRRLSRSTRFNSSKKEVVLRMRNLIIPACERVRVYVAVDFKRTSVVGGQFLLEVSAVQDISSTADVVEGAFPLRTMPAKSSITPQPVGVLTFTPLRVSSIRPVMNELLAKFRIEADIEAHQILYAITLTNKGTARDDDLRNLYLTRLNGRALTPVVKKMDGDTVTFRFSRPYLVKRSNKILFQLRGNAYTSRKTVNFILEEPSDISADPSRRGTR